MPLHVIEYRISTDPPIGWTPAGVAHFVLSSTAATVLRPRPRQWQPYITCSYDLSSCLRHTILNFFIVLLNCQISFNMLPTSCQRRKHEHNSLSRHFHMEPKELATRTASFLQRRLLYGTKQYMCGSSFQHNRHSVSSRNMENMRWVWKSTHTDKA